MNIYNKNGILFLVQLDHLSGEILGDVLNSFYEAGAKNVQIINTITKKNRPGHMIMIDGTEKTASDIEAVIVNECGSSGWHRIETCHRHTDVAYISKTFLVHLENHSFEFLAKGKQIANDPQTIRPEYDSCIELQAELLKYQKKVGIQRIHTLLTNAFLYEDSNILII